VKTNVSNNNDTCASPTHAKARWSVVNGLSNELPCLPESTILDQPSTSNNNNPTPNHKYG
jgi:hypothetical protein